MGSSLVKTCLSNKHVIQMLRITKRHKWISISAAIALSVSLIIRETFLKPPKKIRHIPYQSYFDSLWASLREETYYKVSSRIMLPFINSNNGYNGVFSVKIKSQRSYLYLLFFKQ